MCWNCWYACLAQGCILPKSQGFFHQSDCVKVLDPPKGMWIDCLTHWIWSQICGYSCWWKKSCTTWDVETLVNNGINYQPQLVQDFLHQQSLIIPTSSFFWVILLRSCTKRFRSSSTEECRGMPQNGWGVLSSSSGLPCASRETSPCGFVPHMAVAQTCKNGKRQELMIICIGIQWHLYNGIWDWKIHLGWRIFWAIAGQDFGNDRADKAGRKEVLFVAFSFTPFFFCSLIFCHPSCGRFVQTWKHPGKMLPNSPEICVFCFSLMKSNFQELWEPLQELVSIPTCPVRLRFVFSYRFSFIIWTLSVRFFPIVRGMRLIFANSKLLKPSSPLLPLGPITPFIRSLSGGLILIPCVTVVQDSKPLSLWEDYRLFRLRSV